MKDNEARGKVVCPFHKEGLKCVLRDGLRCYERCDVEPCTVFDHLTVTR